MGECIFCAIVAGRAEASVVVDEDVLVFMDIQPFAEGHTLVVPKRHVQYVGELSADERAQLFEMGSRIGDALREAGLADDVHLIVNDGVAALQSVPHVHLHVLPRRRGDLKRLLPKLLTAVVPPVRRKRRTVLDTVAERIRAHVSVIE